MKIRYLYIFVVIFFLYSGSVPANDNISKNELTSDGKKRSYFLFIPKSANKEKPLSLLVLLHGSGQDGKILVEHWQKIADQEGIILVGPNSLNSLNWSIPNDAPQFIYDLVEELKSKQNIDSHRIYLFGHSAGAVTALMLSLLESEYFAATAVSAGSLRSEDYDFFNDAERKTPVAIFVGTKDPFFPLSIVRKTRDAFSERGFTVELTEILNLDHNYYLKSAEINEKAWKFISKFQLDNDQKYKHYNFSN